MAITSQAVQAKRDLRIGDKIFTFLKYFLLILFSIIALIPVSVCVLTAFKTTDEYNTTNVLTPPRTGSTLTTSSPLSSGPICCGAF